jgi:hypothetical protein
MFRLSTIILIGCAAFLGNGSVSFASAGGKENPCLDPGTNSDPDFDWEDYPVCEYAKYTIEITAPDDGETYEKDSGETAEATAEREGSDTGVTDETASIAWSGDASGSGGTSGDFTTSLGAKTLTAGYDGNSESVEAHIAKLRSFRAKDSSSTGSGARIADASENLVMVYSNLSRTAEIRMNYESSSSYGSNYPKWSGNGLQSASDGDLTVNFSSGVTDTAETITVRYANGSTETITIEVVDDENVTINFDTSNGYMTDILDKGNTILREIYDDDNALKLSGKAKVDFKLVDSYGEASSYGYYASANSSASFSAGSASAKSPPVIVGGVAWRIMVSTSGVTITAAGAGTYDDSENSPGSFDMTISGGTTSGVGGSASVAIVTLSVQGTVGINASGGLSLETTGQVKASGSIGVTNPTLTVTVNVNIGIAEWEQDVGQWQAPLNASQNFGPTTVYTFN